MRSHAQVAIFQAACIGPCKPPTVHHTLKGHLHKLRSVRVSRVLAYSVVCAHLLLLLAYTLPPSWVPDKLNPIAQGIVRPLFHQRWNLFAPDPSPCHCRVEAALADDAWIPLISGDRHYMLRRMDRPLAELIRSDVERGNTRLRPILADALRGLARDIARETGPLRYRLVQHCITDPERPAEREVHITPLELPMP